MMMIIFYREKKKREKINRKGDQMFGIGLEVICVKMGRNKNVLIIINEDKNQCLCLVVSADNREFFCND